MADLLSRQVLTAAGRIEGFQALTRNMTHGTLLKRYFSLSRTQIGYLRFILESYDGLAFVRTLDSRAAVVEIAYPSLRTGDVEALLQALTEEAGMTELLEIPRDIYEPL